MWFLNFILTAKRYGSEPVGALGVSGHVLVQSALVVLSSWGRSEPWVQSSSRIHPKE